MKNIKLKNITLVNKIKNIKNPILNVNISKNGSIFIYNKKFKIGMGDTIAGFVKNYLKDIFPNLDCNGIINVKILNNKTISFCNKMENF